ncbi:MAG: alpha-2-macroglobulin family protein, partial [Flavisolibacter sp.]
MENASGQVKNYEAQWKKIDELVQKNQLPKSALAEVKKIYTQAKAEKQDAQVIKALVYMIRLQEENQEDAELLSIKQIEKEIPTSKEPAASILNNLLANLYWQYLQEHRWELYNRTNTVDFNKSDIATWTLEDLHKKISEVFLESIKNENVLKQTKLEPFDAIIVKGNVRNLRPTLFDLLAHHALQYFSNTERDIKKPAYAFEITQPQAFDMAADFASFKFKTNDSLSLQYKALLIYQDLIRFHLKDPKPDALVDVDLARIDYVYHNSVSDEKDSLYTIALVNTIQKYRGNAMAKQASYMLAAWYEQKANTYQPLKDTQYRYARNEAHRILQEAVNDSSVKNEGWTNSFNLLKEIERKSFSFEVEKVNIPGQPFRALVKYKNTDQLYFRLVKQDETLKQALENRDEQKTWNTLLQAKTVKSWQQSLRATGDMQQHSTEIKIDGLPVGVYYLLASTAQDFNQKKGPLGRQSFYVSNISHANQGNKYFVLDRETGQPLRTAAIQVFKQEYNYKTEKYARTKIGSYRADDHGMFTVELPKENRYVNFYLDITTKDDHLFIDEAVGNYYYYDNDRPTVEETATRIFFFTDRSIYRPGQLVYFKGIVVKTKKTANSIAANYSTTIYLYDANNEKLDSMKVVTNEFGSFNGKFNLPQGTLNGEFIIATKDMESSTEFSVEEYKRPKFHVEFEKIKETYKAGDLVTVMGTAKAYAGNNIDGGKLAFRVVRRPRFIYTWFFRKSWLPPVEEMEIAHGEATTDKDGKFIIQFTAIPDKKLDPKMDPVFDYEVFTDVTDINGETRSASKTVTAGYKSLILRVDLPEKIPIDSLKKISVRTENMNGDFQSSMVEVSIRKLIPADNRLIRQRYWEEPDEFVMSKEEYVRYFPHDEYQHETEFTSWDKGELVATKKDTTSENGQFPINNVQFSSGYYAIEVTTKDKDGKEVKDTKYVELFDPAAKNFNKPEYLWSKASDGLVEPGTNTEVEVGSSAPNVYLINQVSKGDQEKSDFNYLSISNEKKSIMYTATEADRGGYGTNFFFVKDNRLYQFNDVINVPWSNKDLDIEYSSFRDKTLPGSEEKWKLKITGYKNELAAAEMLASMYDASLDQFRMHEWDIPGIWPLYASYLNWNGQSNFTSVMSSMQYSREDYRQFDKQYDRLFFDNENIQYDNVVRLRGRADGVMNYSFSNRESIPKVESAMGLPPVIPGLQMAMKQNTADGDVGADTTAKTSRITDVSNFKSTDNKTIEPSIQPRKNFNETAFFFPELRTDANGAIEFSFNAPEALTKWKFQSLVHTKALAFGYSQKEIVTQKELMVQPNMPRFLRQGDHMELVAKIVNMSDSELTGQAQLELFDATTNQSVDGWFINTFPNQYFTVAAGQSEVVKFPIQVPFQFNNALTWRITARSGNYSDGEEDAMPVLTNKTLVTETMPLPMRGTGTKEFSFEKLLKSGSSESLQHHSLTVEYTSNPAWYAVQALPYLMEYPYDCAEQVWNRYYANALATKIVNAAPRVKEIFKKWKTTDTAALLSNLQKNQELKSALLEETPWVLQAKTETEQKKNIALLFDMVHMANELSANLDKLHQAQSPNGGFVWFKGGPDDRYITQYIISGIGHLKKLGVDINK